MTFNETLKFEILKDNIPIGLVLVGRLLFWNNLVNASNPGTIFIVMPPRGLELGFNYICSCE